LSKFKAKSPFIAIILGVGGWEEQRRKNEGFGAGKIGVIKGGKE